MKTKTEEVQELVILTDEQIEALSEDTKDNVVFLTEKMGAKDLLELNPMVSELIEIRQEGSSLKLKPADKEGNFDIKNIQAFTDIKKRIRSFRATVKKTATTLKEEPAKITKAIIAIEKAFTNEATIVYDEAEKEFDAYIQEQERIKAEKQAKKDAELMASINQAKAEAEEANNKMKITNIYNKVKYEIIGGLSENISEALLNANEYKLLDIKNRYENSSYEDAIDGLEIELLEESVKSELAEKYASVKAQSIRLIKEKLDAIKLERDNAILKATSNINPIDTLKEAEKQIDEVIEPAVPAPPVTSQNYLNDIEFINYIQLEGKRLLGLTVERISKTPHCSPIIYDLRNSLSNFK